MRMTFIIMLLPITLIVGGIFLQIFLSKKENKWLGLILPFVAFAYSLIMVFSIAVFDGMTGRDIFGLAASTFFLSNIPTIILIAIYLGCREKIKRKTEFDKMNIQDLE